MTRINDRSPVPEWRGVGFLEESRRWYSRMEMKQRIFEAYLEYLNSSLIPRDEFENRFIGVDTIGYTGRRQ